MKQGFCSTASYSRKARDGMTENSGFDVAANAPVEPSEIVMVTPDGKKQSWA